MNSKTTVLSLLLLLVPTITFAHTESVGGDFSAGLFHPILGLDHFLAMLSVGIVSSQLGGKHVWSIPAGFVIAMILGAAIGMFQINMPLVEIGIAVSVMILGIGIIFAKRTSSWILFMVLVFFFGVFHGHAHGIEMPNSANPVYYAFGFVISTCCVHLLGVLIGYLLTERVNSPRFLQIIGTVFAAIGVFMLVNAGLLR